ncbi:MAG: archease [Candidatus Latescibacterota bacterium]
MNTGYEYLSEVAIADVALRAWGETAGELFAAAARAVLEVMVSPLATVRLREERRLELAAASVELLLLDFLQEILYHKDAERLFLLPVGIEVAVSAAGARLHGVLAGEGIDPERHDLGVDVKAVTMHRFSVRQEEGRWIAEVVLDV